LDDVPSEMANGGRRPSAVIANVEIKRVEEANGGS
jgi:hypothetical protein